MLHGGLLGTKIEISRCLHFCDFIFHMLRLFAQLINSLAILLGATPPLLTRVLETISVKDCTGGGGEEGELNPVFSVW